MIADSGDRSSRIVIIGVGNEYRGDDAIGLIAARRLRERLGSQADIRELSGEGAAVIDAMQNANNAIIIDAAESGADPGTVFRYDATSERIPTGHFHYSTHAFSVAEAVETARALGQLPKMVIVYGIEGKSFDYGENLSPGLDDAVEVVVDRILSELQPSV